MAIPSVQSVEREVMLCGLCKGSGRVEVRASIHDSEMEPCRRCNGSGRLTKIITTSYEPYIPAE